MHFLTLVTLEVASQPELDEKIREEANKICGRRDESDIMSDTYIRQQESLSSEFARTIDSEVFDKLEPYAEQTYNIDYLEFEDHTDELKKEYSSECVDCIKLPEGKIVSIYNERVWNKFTIHDDGKVYQVKYGKLKLDKRSKKAKKMTAVLNYPYNKLYKSFEEFAEQERCFTYNEEYGGYGYLNNPNAFYDWYSIGGRWPFLFLVKDTCMEFSKGEFSWGIKEERPAPKGYLWVCAARKKDIEWQVMYDWQKKKLSKYFSEYRKYFNSGKCPEDLNLRIDDTKIVSYGRTLYINGETLDDFVSRYGMVNGKKYQISPYSYFHNDEYATQDSFTYVDGKPTFKTCDNWDERVESLIDSLDENTVLVGVDCHI